MAEGKCSTLMEKMRWCQPTIKREINSHQFVILFYLDEAHLNTDSLYLVVLIVKTKCSTVQHFYLPNSTDRVEKLNSISLTKHKVSVLNCWKEEGL